MAMVTQEEALHIERLGKRDRAQFWRAERYDSLECLSASFFSHKYSPHTHDTYVVGTIVSGCERFNIRGELHRAGSGDLVFVNPGEVHDGEPEGDYFTYRMSYPSIALVKTLTIDIFSRDKLREPYFRDPVVHDPALAALFGQSHAAMERAGRKLESDQAFLSAMSLMLTRYSDYRLAARPQPGFERGPVARAKDYLDAHFARDVGLAELAGEAGLSRHYLIRAFRKETGLTPHAYLTDRRVEAARKLLRGGLPPADVALQCGFFDQSHLNKVFKARIGVTPGEFKAQ